MEPSEVGKTSAIEAAYTSWKQERTKDIGSDVRQSIPPDIEDQIDKFLSEKSDNLILTKFREERVQLMELRMKLHELKFEETKFQSWFAILDGQDTRSHVQVLSDNGCLAPFALSDVLAIVKIISSKEDQEEFSNGIENDQTSINSGKGKSSSFGDEESKSKTDGKENSTQQTSNNTNAENKDSDFNQPATTSQRRSDRLKKLNAKGVGAKGTSLATPSRRTSDRLKKLNAKGEGAKGTSLGPTLRTSTLKAHDGAERTAQKLGTRLRKTQTSEATGRTPPKQHNLRQRKGTTQKEPASGINKATGRTPPKQHNLRQRKGTTQKEPASGINKAARKISKGTTPNKPRSSRVDNDAPVKKYVKLKKSVIQDVESSDSNKSVPDSLKAKRRLQMTSPKQTPVIGAKEAKEAANRRSKRTITKQTVVIGAKAAGEISRGRQVTDGITDTVSPHMDLPTHSPVCHKDSRANTSVDQDSPNSSDIPLTEINQPPFTGHQNGGDRRSDVENIQDDDTFEGWETHGFKSRQGVTREAMRFQAVRGWFHVETYLLVLFNPMHFDVMDGSEKRVEVGVFTSNIEHILNKGWKIVKALEAVCSQNKELVNCMMHFREYTHSDCRGRSYVTRVYHAASLSDTRVVVHTRCNGYSLVLCQDLAENVADVNKKVGATAKKLSSILAK